MHSMPFFRNKRCCAFKLSDWVFGLKFSLLCDLQLKWRHSCSHCKISICVNRYRIKIYFHDIWTYPKLTLTNPKEIKQKHCWLRCNILSIPVKSKLNENVLNQLNRPFIRSLEIISIWFCNVLLVIISLFGEHSCFRSFNVGNRFFHFNWI